MLYLFGRLALSDSFYFNQDLQRDEYQDLIARDERLDELNSDAANHVAATTAHSSAALRPAAPAQNAAPYPTR